MATHPVPSEPSEGDEESDTAPNPSRLPVEPEFGPLPPASEPEDPHGRPPPI